MDEQPRRPVVNLFADLAPTGVQVVDLRSLTAEQAAGAVAEVFLHRGTVEAIVSDPAEVRRLVRRDCRNRGVRYRSFAYGGTVLFHDDPRHEAWLATPDGREYRHEADQQLRAAMNIMNKPVITPKHAPPTTRPRLHVLVEPMDPPND